MPTYSRLPVAFERGEGVWLWDTDGKRYLDALSGLGVCSLGHAHPAVVRAIKEQSEKLLHTSNLYAIPEQEHLAKRLASITGLQNAFFCNSGTEANEAAIKLVRRCARAKGVKRPTIVTFAGAFHGRSLAPLAAAKWKGYTHFAPLPGGFKKVPFGDVQALEKLFKSNANVGADVCAVMLEPIQGEGGVHILSDNTLRDIRALCDAHGVWLILDEVQTGVGRTGAWYACEHSGVKPDVLTSAKALGNGVPIGVCLANKALSFDAGEHGSTFGGNPLASAAAAAVLETIEKDGILENARHIGDYIRNSLSENLGTAVREVRGRGMMIGIEMKRECKALVSRALERSLLINVTANKVIRLLPPLIMKMSEAETLVKTLTEVILNSSRKSRA